MTHFWKDTPRTKRQGKNWKTNWNKNEGEEWRERYGTETKKRGGSYVLVIVSL